MARKKAPSLVRTPKAPKFKGPRKVKADGRVACELEECGRLHEPHQYPGYTLTHMNSPTQHWCRAECYWTWRERNPDTGQLR